MVVNGVVRNDNNEVLTGVVVYESDASGKPIGNNSDTTDETGYYNIQITDGNSITASLVGYNALTFKPFKSGHDIQLESKWFNPVTIESRKTYITVTISIILVVILSLWIFKAFSKPVLIVLTTGLVLLGALSLYKQVKYIA